MKWLEWFIVGAAAALVFLLRELSAQIQDAQDRYYREYREKRKNRL